MSFRALRWAFGQPLPPNLPKFTLVYLAMCADDQGKAFPSRAAIAVNLRISERSVTRMLDVLEDAGLISRGFRTNERGKQRGPLYTLNLHVRAVPDRSDLSSQGGDTQDVPPPCPEVGDTHDVPRSGTPRVSSGIPKKEIKTSAGAREATDNGALGRPASMVWINVDTPQFAAWALRWDADRGHRKKPWLSQHPQDRSREGRWVISEWPPKDQGEPDL